MTLYADRLKKHLATYRATRLGVDEHGIHRASSRKYAHILPEHLKRLNIIETIRTEWWDYFRENAATIGLHTDFHHLNSSQAFGFNLLYPFATDEAAGSAFLEALGLPEKKVRKWSFEHMPDPGEGTSVDLHATFDDDTKLLIEVKLTESAFGSAMENPRRLVKFTNTYTPALAGKVKPHPVGRGEFFLNYQLLRSVSHLGHDDTLVLLLPRANTDTWSLGAAFRDSYLTEPTKAAVRMVAAEDLVRALSRAAPARLRTHLELLAEKYLPDLSLTP